METNSEVLTTRLSGQIKEALRTIRDSEDDQMRLTAQDYVSQMTQHYKIQTSKIARLWLDVKNEQEIH